MRPLAALLIASLASAATAHEPDPARDAVLATATDLREHCRQESQARLVGQGRNPANWTARHHEKGNTLVAEGKWRVDGKDVAVTCRVARGARASYATVELAPAD